MFILRLQFITLTVMFLTIIGTQLFAATPTVVSELYFTQLSYANSSNKKGGFSSIFYTSFEFDKYKKFELGLGHTQINYFANIPTLKQQDLTFMLSDTGHLLKNTVTKFGTHLIQNKEGLLEGGKALIMDFTYYKPYPHDYGIQMAYSNYINSASGDVMQIAPHYGKWLTYPGADDTLYLDARAVFIKATHPASSGLSDKIWSSLQLTLSGVYEQWDHKLSVWGGERVYMVDSSGFTMYNLSDRYVGGLNLDIGYRLTKDFRLSAGGGWQVYKEAVTDQSVDSAALTMAVTYNY